MKRENFRQLMRHEDVPRRKAAEERAVCREYARCLRCPYPAHGFICWGDDNCMRKRVLQIYDTGSLRDEKD